MPVTDGPRSSGPRSGNRSSRKPSQMVTGPERLVVTGKPNSVQRRGYGTPLPYGPPPVTRRLGPGTPIKTGSVRLTGLSRDTRSGEPLTPETRRSFSPGGLISPPVQGGSVLLQRQPPTVPLRRSGRRVPGRPKSGPGSGTTDSRRIRSS